MIFQVFPIWQNFTNGILDYAFSTYNALEPWTIPFVLVGIIGFVYAFTQSVVVAVVAILITFGAFATTTTVFNVVPDISIFLYIVAVLGITLLIVILFIKRR